MQPPASSLADLRARLRDHNVDIDPRAIATILLEVAHAGEWIRNPKTMVEWVGQLALDVINE